MPADIHPVYNAYCADCNEGSGPHDDDDDAQAWADEHNAEYHEYGRHRAALAVGIDPGAPGSTVVLDAATGRIVG
jgi:hypothetical protein